MRATGAATALLVVLVLSLPATGNAEKAKRLPIVDQAIEHHGGDVYASSETSLRICSLSGCFRIEARVDGGRFEYDVTETDGGRRVRITNDTTEVWQDGERVPEAPQEPQRWRDWVFARVYFPFLPYGLNSDGVYKEDLGLVEWGGATLHKVKVTFEPGSSTAASDEYLYWFDPETGRIVFFAYSFAGNPGGLRFRRAVDYRRVGGILFFDQENLGVEGEGLRVDLVDQDFVAARMEPVSTVELDDITVRPLHSDD